MSGLGSIFKHKPPKPPASYNLGVSVNSNDAFVTLISDDNLSSYTGTKDRDNHYNIFIFDGKHGQGSNLRITAVGYVPYEGRVALDPPSRELDAVTLQSLFDGPIRTEDNKFYNDLGRWRYKSVTGFLLYKRFLDGENIESFFQWMNLINANCVRIFAGWDPYFYPKDYSNYFINLFHFSRLARKYNLYVENTIFASVTKIYPDPNEQQEFFNQILDATKLCDNMIYELVNENDILVNHLDAGSFLLPNDRVFSRGSNGAESGPVQPLDNYAGFHNERDREWPRRLKNASEFPGLMVCGETTRPDQDELIANNSVQNFLDAGMCAGLMVDGINGHSNSLKDGQVPTGIESVAVESIITGFDRIPIGIREWEYRRSGPDALPPAVSCNSLRTFERRGSDEAYGVTIQRSSEMILDNGWQFVEQTDNFYHIKRA